MAETTENTDQGNEKAVLAELTKNNNFSPSRAPGTFFSRGKKIECLRLQKDVHDQASL
jgi:hypothetical protein